LWKDQLGPTAHSTTVSQLSISELEKPILKPTKPTTSPFPHMKQLMTDAGSASSIRIKGEKMYGREGV
jgi:hypothetical protein